MQTYRTIVEELNSLRAQLKTARQDVADLSSEYDAICVRACTEAISSEELSALRTQKEVLEARIHGLEILVGQKEATQASLAKAAFAQFMREHEEAERAEKIQRWRALNTECAAAKKELEATVEPLKEAQAAIDEQAGEIRRAQNELSHHLETKPRWATDEELNTWNTGLTELEAAVRAAFAEIQRRDDIRSAVIQRQVQARSEFERLAFQVQMAQPPEQPLPRVS